MNQTAKDHPDLVTIVDYGKTYEKRTISLLKVKQISKISDQIPEAYWRILFVFI